jgi:hypothetical protein
VFSIVHIALLVCGTVYTNSFVMSQSSGHRQFANNSFVNCLGATVCFCLYSNQASTSVLYLEAVVLHLFGS